MPKFADLGSMSGIVHVPIPFLNEYHFFIRRFIKYVEEDDYGSECSLYKYGRVEEEEEDDEDGSKTVLVSE